MKNKHYQFFTIYHTTTEVEELVSSKPTWYHSWADAVEYPLLPLLTQLRYINKYSYKGLVSVDCSESYQNPKIVQLV